ncbi:hypothetical protein AMTRI_Chr13g122180 [Amborella trichopoda]
MLASSLPSSLVALLFKSLPLSSSTTLLRSFLPSSHFLFPPPKPLPSFSSISLSTRAMKAPTPQTPTPQPQETQTRKKKAKRESPEGLLRFGLDMCSKHGDAVEAIRLYDDALEKGISLSLHHYNVLLYVCSSPSSTPETLEKGFQIYQRMMKDNIIPNEATFTSAARLAAAKEDGDMAFDLVKQMAMAGIPPRLRSYGPALFTFYKKMEVEKAYAVDAHIISSGVQPEEPELAALLELSAKAKRGDRVYELLQRIRVLVRQVSESTAGILRQWFESETAMEAGDEVWDEEKVRVGIAEGGGGWHGQGWLGKGSWRVEDTNMSEKGVCGSCGEQLVTIDINNVETENFAKSLAVLASQREVRANFASFQDWLGKNGPFEAVVDGANVGLYDQHNFSFFQLNSIVNRLREMSPTKKLPLIVLHGRRVKGGPADSPNNKKLIESWRKAGVLYTTPPGSNDDWYWLYAAVRFKCLLVTNDEMRDHLFELLGTSFFPRWKERHQVRLTVSKNGPVFHMPPPYSIVIQESERGSWHVPTLVGDDIETPRKWLCATRLYLNKANGSEGFEAIEKPK